MAETGRPRLYQDPAELDGKVEEYFAQCADGNKMPTLAGLCVFLGFSDKQSFSHYETYGGEFSLTVKRARLRMEDDRNQRLANPACAGVIFDLKNNWGWSDKLDLNHGAQDSLMDLMKAVDGKARGIPTGG